MTSAKLKAYPGESLTPREILQLAEQYHISARSLYCDGRLRGCQHLPFKLLAAHAIELYLSACLRAKGHDAADVRAMQHHLDRRVAIIGPALRLRKKTVQHLTAMTLDRDYLYFRYDLPRQGSAPPNRILTTLTEVATKVRGQIEPASLTLTSRLVAAENN